MKLVFQQDSFSPQSLNCPEENDETVSEDDFPSILSESRTNHRPHPHSPSPVGRLSVMADTSFYGSELTQSQPSNGQRHQALGSLVGRGPATPSPSWAEGCMSTMDHQKGAWLHPSFASSFSRYPSSLPPHMPSGEYASCYPVRGAHSLPSPYSLSLGSLDQPRSLHSFPPNAAAPLNYLLPPYPCSCHTPACCSQGPVERFGMGPFPRHLSCGASGPYPCGYPQPGCTQSGYPHPHLRQNISPYSMPLSQEHRKVFVTYEADSDGHVNEIIKFVALLRHNGFDTRIDVFEQQFRSISKIDFMEKFIREKDYLIIIVISPKYYETVTGGLVSTENDERALNTVYIHKQLQNEFIQNGSRNFRFIPILFPGAKKTHVPTWLQNTHVYCWPKDRDDILRRLMRVEKYNPPPIGDLPTIISIPL
ncbi:hypothetical protein MATL_G00153440 [Megalops atlanticus]|uniref:E3 ubiquitin ligase TRAF3IP2 n=1 Tax=Megalops atlanticus TaxID=7932 RepID=A0A9D3PXK5_MEGAT|nr:hypothetical protein MATL_G00153440 [Megalops atlanticus]